MHVKDKVCVVTGAASGIGDALMTAFKIPPSRLIGEIKRALEGAIEAAPIASRVQPPALRPTSEREAMTFLASAGVAVVPQVLADTEALAVSTARELGGPVVLKIASPDIAHIPDKFVQGLAGRDAQVLVVTLAAAIRAGQGAVASLVHPMFPA